MPPLKGIYAAAVTPRRLGSEDINLGVMWEIIDFLVERKVDGIVLTGTTGEFVHYSHSERMRVMGLAAKRSRVPVFMNASHSTLDGAVELTQAAAASGAAAILVMPPFFFRYEQSDIRDFYRSLSEQAAVSVPILLYNIPSFTTPVSCGLMLSLIEEGVVQGVKDSSGSAENLQRLSALKASLNFTMFVGNDELIAHAGTANGVISGTAAAIPELLVALHRAVEVNAPGPTEALRQRLHEFTRMADRLPTPVAVRESALLRGLKVGPHAINIQTGALGEFRRWFSDWWPVVENECRHA
jgi:dihydrodipicolinate synthase/N-acetylneuraminate lyase